jgi:hypothetical protein
MAAGVPKYRHCNDFDPLRLRCVAVVQFDGLYNCGRIGLTDGIGNRVRSRWGVRCNGYISVCI